MFDKRLIEFVETRYKNNPNFSLRTQEAVVEAKEKSIVIKSTIDGTLEEIPYGMLLWAGGNALKPLAADLVKKIGPEKGQDSRRGIVVDGHLHVKGAKNIWALGDCTWTALPATAQVAQQEGKYLGKLFNDLSQDISQQQISISNQQQMSDPLSQKLATYEEFVYKHFGSFAYVGDHRAIAELSQIRRENKITSAGMVTYALWRSVYMSKLLSTRNRVSVFVDWMKALIFGRDISRG